ncbi:ras-related protein raba5 [Anaeramoeba ignava]|uniref:Ras-related protein raba5 n=1 Tax=Anaeramoeba ignava TaxID=1746090 RepID=A0A9Q0RFJ5_ANAIG|nr:ras-related protein raba5 [Anaeramoeba ignava]
MESKKENEKYDRSFKVILIGNSAVGKTNILNRFQKNEFNPNLKATIGADFVSRIFEIKGKKFQLKIWDTAGEERYLSFSKIYYRDAVGAFIVYDITNEESFNKLKFWLEEFRKNAQENAVPIIIGNKCDLEKQRKISKEMGQNFANDKTCLFMETSAKDGTNIQEAFEALTKAILNVFENEIVTKINSIKLSNRITKPENDGSCC